jgi:tetratricopeptide (TPR) repeat protein
LKDNPPFASAHPADWSGADQAEWDRVYPSAVALQAGASFDDAIARYLVAEASDSDFAELHFRLGQIYMAAEQFDQARAAYVQARDCDALRFRADSGINSVIREFGKANNLPGARFLDAEAVLAADDRTLHDTTGDELLLDHVHLNFEGNYVVARALFQEIISIIDGRDVRDGTPVLSVDECAEKLAYTDFDQHLIRTHIRLLMEQPPFTNQLDHEMQASRRLTAWKQYEDNHLATAATEAVDQYHEAIASRPDDWILKRGFAELLCGMNRYYEAAKLVEEIRERFPDTPAFKQWQVRNLDAMAQLVSLYVSQGDSRNAVEQFEQMLWVARMAGFEDIASALRRRRRAFESSGNLSALDLSP